MEELSKLPNIGKVLEKQLNQTRIFTIEQLKCVGSKETWLRIKSMDPSACINRLYALEGAIKGIRWHYLDKETKCELKLFYQSIQNGGQKNGI